MEIQPYSAENLAKALANGFTPVDVIQTKHQYNYLFRYLGTEGLNAQSIVVEDEYVSKDFLQDYSAYYAMCFEKYPKFCKRLHFFKTTISPELLNNMILEKQAVPADFWNNYLGFIVVKPIPTTVIGFSVLRDYNSSDRQPDRFFWGLREYKVHFFGYEYKIESLAFQEQDSVLAACATTAIWSMLNKAAEIDYHTTLKSPSQITRDADNVSPDGSRLFPNKGLSVIQICQAIFNSGLVSEVKPPDFIEYNEEDEPIGVYVSNLYTKKILNAYSPLGIPIILVIKVPDGDQHGLHAITVSGYKQQQPSPITPKMGVSWHAENIDRIYAHDDQHGPFARIDLQNEIDLKTPWTDNHVKNLPTRVTNIIVPLFPKVRISYEDIDAIVLGLDTILTLFFDKKMKHDLVWDIKIEYSEKWKGRVKKLPLSDEEKLKRLVKSQPKYLWIARCTIGNHTVLEITFDATDVNHGMIAKDVIYFLPPEQQKVLKEYLILNKTGLIHLLLKRTKSQYFDFLLKHLE